MHVRKALALGLMLALSFTGLGGAGCTMPAAPATEAESAAELTPSNADEGARADAELDRLASHGRDIRAEALEYSHHYQTIVRPPGWPLARATPARSVSRTPTISIRSSKGCKRPWLTS